MGGGQGKVVGNSFEIRDCVPVTYLWIDANIDGTENQTNLGHFKNNFKILAFSKIKDLQAAV
jgi:hypothetical protein